MFSHCQKWDIFVNIPDDGRECRENRFMPFKMTLLLSKLKQLLPKFELLFDDNKKLLSNRGANLLLWFVETECGIPNFAVIRKNNLYNKNEPWKNCLVSIFLLLLLPHFGWSILQYSSSMYIENLFNNAKDYTSSKTKTVDQNNSGR